MARDKTMAVAKIHEVERLAVKPLVILAGGSLRNESLCHKVNEKGGERSAQLTTDGKPARRRLGVSINFPSTVWMPNGMIHATWYILTVRGFFQQGAGIGLRTCQAGQRKKNPVWDRDYHIVVFYDPKAKFLHPRTLKIDAAAGDRLRLVCDPFGPFLGLDIKFDGWETEVPKPFYRRTYDLLEHLPVPESNSKEECEMRFRSIDVEKGGFMAPQPEVLPTDRDGPMPTATQIVEAMGHPGLL
ncbi:hypothetical protein B0T20DRAFT_495898 [Sordaria brevicollis]|uniref:Uncharacterized protein n=1 Tax=Sordaria brevicollis TaxID=83679 RepID=A0AAE0PGY8_SORBR|nr:hypothetical protein B0T20DRAFT_495898 [Sordaria brevicollis]